MQTEKGRYPVRRLTWWLRFKRFLGQLVILALTFGFLLGLLYALLPIDEMFVPMALPTADYAGDDWMAVLGDSSVTGAAAHPSLQATWPTFGQLAQDLLLKPRHQQHLPPNFGDFIDPVHYGVRMPLDVTRVFYAPAEIKGWNLPRLNAQAKAALKLDNEEYSFAYLVGRRLGFDGRRIVFAGQDGAQVNQLSKQARRLFAIGAKSWPKLALVSFVANDMCDPKRFALTPQAFGERFRETLKTQFAEIAKMPAHPGGTRIVYLAPLDLANVLSNAEILAQPVQLDVNLVTCRDLRGDRAVSGWIGRPVENILRGECPALLNPGDFKERVAHVRALQEEQIRVLAKEIAAFKAPGFTLDLASSPRRASFRAGDLAADCFHPGIGGHARIANALLANEFRQPVELPTLGVTDDEEPDDP